jgi:chemotaxis protein methyltransferase CheR
MRSWSVTILATDTSERALRRAREGVYTASEVQRGLTRPTILRHFTPKGECWQIAPSLRRGVRFQNFNILHEFTELGFRFDIVFMRNVLIYLDARHKTEVLGRLHTVIQPDGYLFLGESETILGLTDDFAIAQSDDPFYRPALTTA